MRRQVGQAGQLLLQRIGARSLPIAFAPDRLQVARECIAMLPRGGELALVLPRLGLGLSL